jgi:Na+/H+ antiporter NhaC
MEATVGIFKDHEVAVKAVKHLILKGVDEKEISLIGTGTTIEDHVHINSVKSLKKAPVPVGMVAGGVLGVLAGAGILAVPGLGVIFLAGKFVGLISGLALGAFGGSIASFLIGVGFKQDQVVKFEKHLEDGHYLVVINGSDEHISQAHILLHGHDEHEELHK